MERSLYSSIEEMLAPETLSELEGQPVTDVRCMPFHPSVFQSASGSRFLIVETNDGQGQRYFLKRISLEWDWIMRATADHLCRSMTLWRHRLLDRLPPEIDHAVVACAVAGPGWAILIRDVSAALMPPDDQLLSVEDNERFLDAMAALHASFWEEPSLANPALGLCSLWHQYTCLSPKTGHREIGGPDAVPPRLVEGWDLLQTLVEPDVADVLQRLLEDPQPLCDALGRYPQTLVHGDWRVANLGLLREQRAQVVLLDWGLAGLGSPMVDLAWYLATNHMALPVSQETAIACYRHSLARRLGPRFDERWWQPQLELGLLGGLVRVGCLKAWHAIHDPNKAKGAHDRVDLAWWSEQVRAGVRWL